jgi:cytochrome c biogenesis protein CcmG, thiol:disulfide interchange protein DsbE
MRFAIPFALFAVVVAFLAVGLQRDPRLIPSPLIGKPLPTFELPKLSAPAQRVTAADLVGQVYLINVWASWCVACREEHPLLVELARQQQVPLIGMNYKDERPAARAWLERHGNPYRFSLFDAAGNLGIDLGVYGVPETFLIDARGVIRYKHVGPLSQEIIEKEFLTRVHEYERSSG